MVVRLTTFVKVVAIVLMVLVVQSVAQETLAQSYGECKYGGYYLFQFTV